MATFSIFDDDRSATPDFFHIQKPDPLQASNADLEAKAPTKPKSVVDHDTNNFREDLWRFPDVENLFLEKCRVIEGIDTQKAPAKPPLKRWYWRYNTDGTRKKVPLCQKKRLMQAPTDDQVHIGYRVWNVSSEKIHDIDIRSEASVSFKQSTIEEQCVTPPASPPPSLSDPKHWASRSSSLSISETISEEHRKSVARKQYYERSGLLWECASMLLEPLSLHPTNLAEYEFVKLVCLQGYEIFEWLSTNYAYLKDRAEGQWHQAQGLLTNSTGLSGLNANFMDDFLWMNIDDQISFIKSYRRLQLQAMALREGVSLPNIELDALCMMSDEDKVATIVAYKNEALQMTLQSLQSFNHKEIISNEDEGMIPKADNFHLNFLYGLGSDKHDPFQEPISMADLAEGHEEVHKEAPSTDDRISVLDTQKLPTPMKTVFDVHQHITEPISSSSGPSNIDSLATTVAGAEISKSESKYDLSPDCLNLQELPQSLPVVDGTKSSPRTSRFSEEETFVEGAQDFPQLERHKLSYNDLRGLASTIRVKGHATCYGNTDEDLEWDFKPDRSLRKKASKLFGALKKPFTLSSRKPRRATVKDYFN